MREIKFRAWDKKISKMQEVSSMPLPNTDGTESEHRTVIYMQFTGLKDKNGKEIFEGDIVRSSQEQLKRTVIWKEYGFYLSGAKDWEVIGNCFENPELLTKTI